VNSVIIRTAARLILPILILFSFFMLLRGHYEPGGGFIGGLIAATAFILLALAGDLGDVEAIFPVERLHGLMAVGLAISLISGLLPLFLGEPFLKGLWLSDFVSPGSLPGDFDLGTSLFFDIGVYIVVLSMALAVVLRLIEEVEVWKS
jgi:multicomponent Na+:H+ antiporter subunit B